MKKNTFPLLADSFYHVYNRGSDGALLFRSERGFQIFLEKYGKHITPYADTFAYCLLNNHFHFLIRIKSANAIIEAADLMYKGKVIDDLSAFLSKQFSHLFNGYTQWFNNLHQRTGSLFETPFRRIEVDNDAYFSQLVSYIHRNPEKHGLVDDFKVYPYSSYWSFLGDKLTQLKRDDVLDWFGGKGTYVNFHKNQVDTKRIKKLIIEF